MIAVLGAAVAPSRADAALNAYLKLVGTKQGHFRGEAQAKNHQGMIEVRHVTQEVASPRDAATGMASGRRQHRPLSVTLPVDSATPLIFKALVDNESLSTAQLEFYNVDRAGREHLYYTIKLTNASIASYSFKDAEDGSLQVQIQLTFQRIEVTYADGGITATDDWNVAR
jgi:type VI secretion system secreted protein Hcp